MQIIPVVISKTGNFHTSTLAEIPQRISFKENPPEALTYTTLPKQAQKIAMALHVRAQKWLTLMSKVSRSTLKQPRRPTHNATYANIPHWKTTTCDPQHRPPRWKVTREDDQEEEAGLGEATD
jgi:hypothetical protein